MTLLLSLIFAGILTRFAYPTDRKREEWFIRHVRHWEKKYKL